MRLHPTSRIDILIESLENRVLIKVMRVMFDKSRWFPQNRPWLVADGRRVESVLHKRID
jgi:hypothetical protein